MGRARAKFLLKALGAQCVPEFAEAVGREVLERSLQEEGWGAWVRETVEDEYEKLDGGYWSNALLGDIMQEGFQTNSMVLKAAVLCVLCPLFHPGLTPKEERCFLDVGVRTFVSLVVDAALGSPAVRVGARVVCPLALLLLLVTQHAPAVAAELPSPLLPTLSSLLAVVLHLHDDAERALQAEETRREVARRVSHRGSS
eukprot:Rhum_TRINITY_DN14601_c39_g1::Rhum_TRINITY_DN14601_c39_g1_i1::g.104955::m.104955